MRPSPSLYPCLTPSLGRSLFPTLSFYLSLCACVRVCACVLVCVRVFLKRVVISERQRGSCREC